MKYNEVIRSTNDEQLLANIVRLRYADSPVFIDLPNITSQFEIAGIGEYTGGVGGQIPGTTHLGFGQITARDAPTLSYHPREGREIAKALLTPLSADLFSVVNAGANVEQLLLMVLNDINDVPNAPRATVMVPRLPDDNTEFLAGVRLLASLMENNAVEMAIATTEESAAASDSVPEGQVQGGDLLSAAKDGYVYRTQSAGRMTLVKRERNLVLRVRRQSLDAPELLELERVFRVTPGLRLYRVKSELTAEAGDVVTSPLGSDTFYLNMRSILQIMTFLSKGVSVPEEHLISREAPSVCGLDGRPYDWTRVTAGNFRVVAQKHRPRDAEVAIPYRGYWFYIPRNDVNSRAVLAILEILFSLQESDGKAVAPLLTLPIGG